MTTSITNTLENYSPEELKTVINAVSASGLAVAIADLGIISTAIEAAALAKEIAGAAAKYPHNAVIQSVFSAEAIKKVSPAELSKDITPENATDKAIAAIHQAVAILKQKGASAQDIREYQAFIYASAERVAEAAASGLLGTGAQKVSPEEAVALGKLKTVLTV